MSLITREMAAQNGTGHAASDGDARSTSTQRLQVAQRIISSANGEEVSRDYNAPPSSFSAPKQNGGTDKRTDVLADFFSSEVFQIVLHNPTTAHRMLKFSQARMCGENMEFLEKVGGHHN